MGMFLQLLSNDLALRYTNISVEPYGELSVASGVPSSIAETGQFFAKYLTLGMVRNIGVHSCLVSCNLGAPLSKGLLNYITHNNILVLNACSFSTVVTINLGENSCNVLPVIST